MKGVDERIDESIFRLFFHTERMDNGRIAKRVYVGECVGSHLVDRPRKRWINSVNEEKRFECFASKDCVG